MVLLLAAAFAVLATWIGSVIGCSVTWRSNRWRHLLWAVLLAALSIIGLYVASFLARYFWSQWWSGWFLGLTLLVGCSVVVLVIAKLRGVPWAGHALFATSLAATAAALCIGAWIAGIPERYDARLEKLHLVGIPVPPTDPRVQALMPFDPYGWRAWTTGPDADCERPRLEEIEGWWGAELAPAEAPTGAVCAFGDEVRGTRVDVVFTEGVRVVMLTSPTDDLFVF